MIILNKSKHFEKISCDLLNKSRVEISELNVILTKLGLKNYIEANKDNFVIVSWLYLLFYQEIALQKKYTPKYHHEVCVSLDYMLDAISNRFNYNFEKLKDLYSIFRKMLDNMSQNEFYKQEVGLYYMVAVSYLQNAFGDEYNFEDVGITDDIIEHTVAVFFQTAMQGNMNYFSLK